MSANESTVKVLFKLRDDVSEDDRANVIGLVERAGIGGVRPLFPGESDAELASIFVAEAPDATAGHLLREQLASLDGVQYAEEEPSRKLLA